MPPTSLSQTPLFQHLLSSLPSLRSQIKDAVTATMKQWLLDIRNVSAQVGQLALDEGEVVGDGLAVGAADEVDLACRGHAPGLPGLAPPVEPPHRET